MTHFIGTKSDPFERKLMDKLLMNYNTDVRPVENTSQVLEVTVALQPYRLLRVVRVACVFHFESIRSNTVNATTRRKFPEGATKMRLRRGEDAAET